MTAIERAKALHWDVTPCPSPERNPTGVAIAIMVNRWNREALQKEARWRKLGRDVGVMR